MKKVNVLISLAAMLIATTAMAEDKLVASCFEKVGEFPRQTQYSASVYVTDGELNLTIISCSGVLNWGCGNGMNNLINERYMVLSEDSLSFHGKEASFERLFDGSYLLRSEKLSRLFKPEECTNVN